MRMTDWGRPTFVAVVATIAVGKPLVVASVARAAAWFATRRGAIVKKAASPAQRERERKSQWLVLTDAAVLVAFCAAGAFRFAADTPAHAALTFVSMFVWVDLFMYLNHVAMHRIPLCIAWHRHHHASLVPRAESALSFSFMEKMACYTVPWLGGAALLSRVLPISLTGLGLFYVFYFFASAVAHANVEMLKPHADPARFSLLGSSTTHALHHVYPDKNFAFFTTLYDRLFGTHARAEDYRAMSAGRSAP